MRYSKLNATLLCAASVIALSTSANAQPANSPQQGAGIETVTVTGSLVISNIQNSPTQITAVSPDVLLATSPDNLADALEKLPAFLGSTNQRGGATSTVNGQAGRHQFARPGHHAHLDPV